LLNAFIPSNGLSHAIVSEDFTQFAPEVRKSLQKLQLVRDDISIAPIVKKIAPWPSPPEQLFYVTFIYLRVCRRIDPKIQIQEQYHVATDSHTYRVDFRLSLADEVYLDQPALFMFVECDSRAYHDRTPHEFEAGRERLRQLQRQGGKAYPFAASQLLKKPLQCVIECVQDLQRDLLTRREQFMKVGL